MKRIFKTKKGTELPLLNLKGKDYLQVAHRLVFFREEHPEWSIETEFLSQNDQSAICRATIKNESGRIIATSHKEESLKDFPAGHREKAETAAIGRALALCGFGTQFEPEFDEGNRIVDSPITPRGAITPEQPSIDDGLQREGYRIGTCSKELVEHLGENPAGKLVEDLHRDTTHKFIGYFEDKYNGKVMPAKATELYDQLVAHAMTLEQ